MARTPKPWYRNDRKCWFVTIDGQRQYLGPNRKAAFQRFHELIAEPKRRALSAESVAAIFDAFLESTRKHRAKRTFEWYQQRCQWFLDAHPSLTVVRLKPYHVQQWVDSHSNWSDGHQRGCIIAVQRPFNWAVKLGYIEHNPIAHLEKPQQGRREQIIAPDEFAALLTRIQDEPFHDLIVTAWETGAWPQELLHVEARHVELKNSRWVFPKAEAKGKRQVRIVYLTETAVAVTQRLMLKHPQGPLFRNTQDRPWRISP